MNSNESQHISNSLYPTVEGQHHVEVDSKKGKNSGLIAGQNFGNIFQFMNGFDPHVTNAPPDDSYDRFVEALVPYDAYAHLTTIQRVKAPVPGTCEWLINLEEYTNWRDGDSQVSWLVGGPAMGKTVLSAYVVQNLIELNKGAHGEGFTRCEDNARDQKPWLVAYYFCDSSTSTQLSLNGILSGLLRQLLRDGKELFAKCRGISHQGIETNTLDALWNFFRDILDKISRKVFVIVDGLDECDPEHTKQFLELLSSDVQMHRIGAHVKFMISSRPEQHIRQFVEHLPISLTIDPSNVESDVHKVIRHKLYKSTLKATVGCEKVKEIEEVLIRKSQKTFLWVHLVFDNLIPTIRNDQKLVDIVEMLEKLPPGLPEIYDQILRQICINNDQFERAAFILPLVAITRRPLKVADIDMAFAMETTVSEKVPKIPIPDVWKSCLPFVFCDHETSTVHLIHVSAKEYILSRRPKDVLKKARFGLFLVALALLSIVRRYFHRLSIFFECFQALSNPSPPSRSMGPVNNLVTSINGPQSMTTEQIPRLPQSVVFETFPFSEAKANFIAFRVSLDYLSKEDFDHGKKIFRRGKGQRLVSVVGELSEGDKNCFVKYAATYWTTHAMAVDPLFLVEYLRDIGHLATLEPLRDSLLLSAAENGNEIVLRFLVNEMGARINVANSEGHTALHLAALGGELNIVRFLIDHGANQHTKDEAGASAIHFAVRGGHMEIFRYLLAQRLHVEYNTWLTYWNAKYPSGKIHDLIGLLSPSTFRAVQYEMPDDQGATLLVWAIESESKELVDFLLAQKVRINYLYVTDISRFLTTYRTFDSIVEHLEDFLEQLEFARWKVGGLGARSPLSRAASKGQDSIIKALLDAGADRYFEDKAGCTPVFWACKRGHESAAKLLMTDRRDHQEQLGIAIKWRDLRATKNLIKFGISDVNQHIHVLNREYGFDFTPTTMAAALDNEEALQFLMECTGATFNGAPQGPARIPALCAAVMLNSEKALPILLSSDLVNVNQLTDTKATPLMAAIACKRESAVQLLLDSKKVDTGLRAPSGRTPLSMAAASGNKSIFDMVSAHGRFSDFFDSTQRTALFYAIRGGNHAIVESVLSDPSVSVMAKDIYGAIPLVMAARLGDTVSSMMLLHENARAQLMHKDKFGRTALAWAAYCSHTGTRDFLSRKCKEFGVSSEDENVCPIIRQIKRDNELNAPICAVCCLQMGNGELVYSCRKCWLGKFPVCCDCRDRLKPQPGCLQETHTLKLYKRKAHRNWDL